MRLLLLAASNKQPDWVTAGYQEYASRLRGRFVLELKEVKLARRGAGSTAAQAVAEEGERLLAAVPAGAHVVALSERGTPWSSTDLAAKLDGWSALGAPVCFLLGGPDGLSPRCLERAREQWCLSPLTLPHGLARIIVAEALYRAWSLLERHPYHRA